MGRVGGHGDPVAPGAAGTADLSCGGIGTPGKNVDSCDVDSLFVDVSEGPDSSPVLGISPVTEGIAVSGVDVTLMSDGTTNSAEG